MRSADCPFLRYGDYKDGAEDDYARQRFIPISDGVTRMCNLHAYLSFCNLFHKYALFLIHAYK